MLFYEKIMWPEWSKQSDINRGACIKTTGQGKAMTLTKSTSNIFLVLEMVVNTSGHLYFVPHFMTVV